MKIAAYCLFALAVVTTFVAINNIFLAAGANRPEGDVNLVSYAVGAFLMPVIFLIVGLILFNKAKKPVDKDMT